MQELGPHLKRLEVSADCHWPQMAFEQTLRM